MKKNSIIFLLILSFCSKKAPQNPDLLSVVLNGSEIASLDPIFMQTDSGSYRIGFQIYDRLAMENTKNEFIKSRIVENIKKVSPSTFHFQLKKNIVFHNQTPLLAKDVVFSLNRAINSPFVQQFFTLIKSIKEVSPFIVEINLYFPNNHLLEFLSQVPASIVSKDIVLKDPKQWSQKPIGSGHFQFIEWRLNQYVLLKRFYSNDKNDSYLEKNGVKILKFLWIPNEYARYLALKTQKVDIVYDLNPFSAKDLILSHTQNLDLYSSPSLTLNYIGFNHKSEIFRNLKNRLMLFNLIDREFVTRSAYGQFAKTAYNFISPLSHSFKMIENGGKQIVLINSILRKRSLRLITVSDSKRLMMATNLQSQLKQFGIDLRITSSDWGGFMQSIRSNNFDLFIYPEAGRFIYPLYLYKVMYYHNQPHNMIYFSHKSVNFYIDQLAKTNSNREEIKLIQKINQLLKETLPTIPLNFPNQLIGYNKKVKNIKSFSHNIIDFSTILFTKN